MPHDSSLRAQSLAKHELQAPHALSISTEAMQQQAPRVTLAQDHGPFTYLHDQQADCVCKPSSVLLPNQIHQQWVLLRKSMWRASRG
eukprot:1158892-Pelagomonas_calceolata.AAC.23